MIVFLKNSDWRKKVFLLIGILTSALILRCWRISAVGLWMDEAWRIYEGQFLFDLPWDKVWSPTNLYPFFLGLWAHIAGTNEIIWRMPSVVWGTASVGLIFEVARRHLGTCSALWAAALLAVSPLAVTYSQEVGPYMLGMFLLLAIQALAPQGHLPRKWQIFCLILLGAIEVLVVPYSLFYVLTLFIGLRVGMSGRVRWLVAVAFMGLLIPAFLWFVARSQRYPGGDYVPRVLEAAAVACSGVLNFSNGYSLFSPQPFPKNLGKFPLWTLGFGLLVLLAWIFLTKEKDREMRMMWMGFSGSILLLWLITLISHQTYERYFLIFQPIAILLCLRGVALIQAGRWMVPVRRLALTGLFSFWLTSSLTSSYAVVWKGPHREALTALRLAAEPGGGATCLVPYPFEWPIAFFYLQKTEILLQPMTVNFYADLREALALKNTELQDLAAFQLHQCIQKHPRQIFFYTQSAPEMLPKFREILGAGYGESVVFQKEGVQVLEFRKTVNAR